MIKSKLKTDDKPRLVLASFTAAYTALVCGLKLDGHTSLPWTFLLSPVWFPIAAILCFAACWLALFIIVAGLHRVARKMRGGL